MEKKKQSFWKVVLMNDFFSLSRIYKFDFGMNF